MLSFGKERNQMKKVTILTVAILATMSVTIAGLLQRDSRTCQSAEFAFPAAEESFVTQGDMSRNLTDEQMIDAIKKGRNEEYVTRTMSCTLSCTVNCSRSCSTCCTHQCGRGY